jgi:hypothetical protein
MTLTEQRKQNEILERIELRIKSAYPEKHAGKYVYYEANNGQLFRVSAFPGCFALVVEYAENESMAKKCLLEDGDRFYLDEMTEDEVFSAIVAEIELAVFEERFGL